MSRARMRVRWRRGSALPVPRYRTRTSEEDDGILVTNARGIVLEANSRACEMLDRSREELVYSSVTKLLQQDEVKAILRRRESPNLWATSLRELRMVRKDGSTILMEVRARSLTKHKQTFILRDITDKRRAEEELRRVQEHFRTIYEAGIVGVMFSSDDGSVWSGNDELLRITGYSREDLAEGKISWLAMSPPECAEVDRIATEQALRDGKYAPYEKEFIRKDGRRAQVLIGGVMLNAREVVSCVVDISRRKEAEAAQREWMSRYQAAVLASGQALYEFDLSNDEVIWAGDTEAILGYTADELAGKGDRWMSLIHPEDRAFVELGASRIYAARQPFRVEYRVLHKDGHYIHIQDHGNFMFDEGRPAPRIVGFIADISDRKRDEEVIRSTNKRMIEILESISDSFMVVDRDWRFKYINTRAANLMGLEAEGVLGECIWERFPALLGTIIESRFRSAMAEQVAARFEAKAQGGRWIEVRAYPSAEGLTIYASDVTERKRAEEALRESEQRLRFAVESAKLMILDWWAPSEEKRQKEDGSVHMGIPVARGFTASLDSIHPEDRERVGGARRRAADEGGDYAMEFRLLRADGTEMWVSDRGRVTRGKNGAATRITDVFMDITEKKRLEEKLREHEQRRGKIDVLGGSEKSAGEREGRAGKGEEALDLEEVIRAAVEGMGGSDGAGSSERTVDVRMPSRSTRVIADREELIDAARDLLKSARRAAGEEGRVEISAEVEATRASSAAIVTIRGVPAARHAGMSAELRIRLPLDPDGSDTSAGQAADPL